MNYRRLDDDDASRPRVHHLRCLPLVWTQRHCPNDNDSFGQCLRHLDKGFHLNSLNPDKIQLERERFEQREGVRGRAIIRRERVVVVHPEI